MGLEDRLLKGATTMLGAAFAACGGMSSFLRPQVVAFDVIETLFSLESVRERLLAIGLAPQSLEVWFGSSLRDAFALTVSEKYAPFESLLFNSLEELLAEHGRKASEDELGSVMGAMMELPVHPDVQSAFEMLRDANVAVMALSNGAKAQTQTLLARANLSHLVRFVVSTDEVEKFKPHRAVYEHAAHIAGIKPQQMALVAAHGWDVHGAKCAGLSAGWIKRREQHFSKAFAQPDVRGETLGEVVRSLLQLP